MADRFHVVLLINQHFLALWKQHDEDGRRNRGLLSLMRRHEWTLKDEQRVSLMNYLEQFPGLKALYEAKQKLIRYTLLKTLTPKRMRRKLPSS